MIGCVPECTATAFLEAVAVLCADFSILDEELPGHVLLRAAQYGLTPGEAEVLLRVTGIPQA